MPKLVLIAFLVGCATAAAPDPATPAAPKGTTESEWAAASDLAVTLARAAGGQRIAPALRLREKGEVRRHLTLAGGGCYHVGVAWMFASGVTASVVLDRGTNDRLEVPERKISAPGGAIDFCTDHAGGATVTLRPTGTAPDTLEVAVVYGAAPETPRARTARHAAESGRTRTARQ